MKIRGQTISYTSYKAKIKGQCEQELQQELTNVEKKLAKNPNENVQQEYVTTIK